MASNLRYRDYASPVHPLADFFSKQLPMMLQQHKQNQQNRLHEKDMAQIRLDSQKELAMLNDELAGKRQLETFELKDAQNRLNSSIERLQASDRQLQELYGIVPTLDKVNDKDATGGANELVSALGEQAQRSRDFAISDYSSNKNYLSQVLDNISLIEQEQAHNNELLQGANFGARVANLVTDVNKDDKLNADDVAAYFESTDALTKELTPTQQIGFDKTFPSAQETFYKQLNDEYLAQQRKVKAESDKAEASADIINRNPRQIHNEFVKQYTNEDVSDDFLSKINTVNIESYDKDHFEKDPKALSRTTSNLVTNLWAGLHEVEDGLWAGNTDKRIDNALDAIKATNDDSIKKQKCMIWLLRF